MSSTADEAPVTLITGSSRGIGRHLAERYLARGHRVVGCSRGGSDLLHDHYTHFSVDVADEGQVRNLFFQLRKDFGRLDHLVNNAGAASMNHVLVTPGSTLRDLFSVNALGSFLFSRDAAKLMKGRRVGRIVNFTTVAVPLRLAGEAAYVASKAAVEGLTRTMAVELAPMGITVNAVGPCPVETDLIRGVPREKIEALLRRQAIPEYGTVEDVAHVVDFLIAPESRMITGQVLYMGGV